MQTLNVGTGRTENEYKAAEEQRRADLRASSREDANYFFWAAGFAALSAGLLPVRVGFLIQIGTFELLNAYGGSLDQLQPLVLYCALVVILVVVLVALGLAARRGHRWAFLAGILLYATDMMILMVMFSLWAFGVHAFFVLKWFQGQKALKHLNEPGITTFKNL